MQKSNLNKPLKFMANMLMPHEKVLSQDPEVEVAKTGGRGGVEQKACL